MSPQLLVVSNLKFYSKLAEVDMEGQEKRKREDLVEEDVGGEKTPNETDARGDHPNDQCNNK